MSARRVKDEMEGVNLLDLAPFRLAEWELVDDAVVLTRPKPSGFRPSTWVDWISYAMSMRKIRLDAFGSFSWQQLERNRTVRDVAKELRRHFGEEIEPAEERLGHFVRLLRREKLLGYPEWDERPTEQL